MSEKGVTISKGGEHASSSEFRLLLLILASLTVAGFATVSMAGAEGDSSRTHISGAGTYSCGKMTSVIEELGAREQFKQWVSGFLSGYNHAKQTRQVKWPDDEAAMAYVEKFCMEKPLAMVYGGAITLVEQLTPQ